MLKAKSCPCSGRTAPRRGGKLCKPCLSPALQKTGEKMGPPASHLLPSHLHPAPMPCLMLQSRNRKVWSSFQSPSLLIRSCFNRFTANNQRKGDITPATSSAVVAICCPSPSLLFLHACPLLTSFLVQSNALGTLGQSSTWEPPPQVCMCSCLAGSAPLPIQSVWSGEPPLPSSSVTFLFLQEMWCCPDGCLFSIARRNRGLWQMVTAPHPNQ